MDTVAGTRPNKLYNDYVTHSTYDDFWKTIGTRHKLDKIRIPVYLMSGWYDNYPGAVLEYFQKLTKLGWEVFVIWECETRRLRDRETLLENIHGFLQIGR